MRGARCAALEEPSGLKARVFRAGGQGRAVEKRKAEVWSERMCGGRVVERKGERRGKACLLAVHTCGRSRASRTLGS